MTKRILILLATAGSAWSQTVPVTVKVSDEIVPPGGMAQMKVLLTAPQPIPGGGMAFDALGVDGISLFSSTGDVYGVAVSTAGRFDVRFVSPHGTFGTSADYPLMTVTFGVGTNVVPGQTIPMSLIPSGSWFRNFLGLPIPVELKPGSITIGGSVSITNVVPGGGVIPAGTTVRIEGIGFTPKTKVRIKELTLSTVVYVSPSAIDITLPGTTSLDGAQFQVTNPDGSSDTYYSYLRAIPLGQSGNPLFARTVPIFSSHTAFSALLPLLVVPPVGSSFSVGLAVQNPSLAPSDVTMQLQSALGSTLKSLHVTLPPGTRIVRDLQELFGVPAPFGASVRVTATQPVQVLGLLGNEAAGTIEPFALQVRNAGSQPSVVADGPRHGGAL